jgi:hypothetical protein
MSEVLPVNVTEDTLVARANALAGVTAVVPAVPDVSQLASWSQENYQLEADAAASLGFPVVHLASQLRHRLCIFGASRWCDVSSGDGHVYRFGVSLRVLIEIESKENQDDLTLPNIAASVQLGTATASAQLIVRGYSSPSVGKLLPPWQSFSVDSYAQYMSAISAIQSEIMANDDSVVPQLLASTIASATLPSSSQAVGTVVALRAVADGRTLQEALNEDHGDEDDRSVRRNSIEQQYRVLNIPADASPTEEQQLQARQQLGDLATKHRWWIKVAARPSSA